MYATALLDLSIDMVQWIRTTQLRDNTQNWSKLHDHKKEVPKRI